MKMATVLYPRILQMFKMEIPLCKYHNLLLKYIRFTWNKSYWNIYIRSIENTIWQIFWVGYFYRPFLTELVLFERLRHFRSSWASWTNLVILVPVVLRARPTLIQLISLGPRAILISLNQMNPFINSDMSFMGPYGFCTAWEQNKIDLI